MPKKLVHPNRELFDHLNGALDPQSARSVEDHLSNCSACASAAAALRGIKAAARNFGSPAPKEPEVSSLYSIARHADGYELGAFFADKLHTALRWRTAAHVALCKSCADELAQFASTERLASKYSPASAAKGEVPAAAWVMINDWEDTEGRGPSQRQMSELSRLLSERKDELRKMACEMVADANRSAEMSNLVPVIVVDHSAQFRRVELFEKATGPRGSSLLKHAEHSYRFDNKVFHALLDFGEKSFVVVSDFIRRDTIRLQRVTQPEAALERADYFIVED